MDKPIDPHHLRAIILRIQDYLSDNDRKCLHFFLGPDVPRRIRDDPSLGGTLNLMESLFDQDKISERDFTFLINAFDEIRCLDAVKILKEHMKQMQEYGLHESIHSLTSILLQDQNEEDDRLARENNNLTTNINQLTVVFDKQLSKQRQKYRPNITKFFLLFIFLLLIGSTITVIIYIIDSNECKENLETKKELLSLEQVKIKNFSDENQQLSNQLKKLKQILTPINIPKIPINATWSKHGTPVAGGNGAGSGLNQLHNPHGIYIDDDRTVYIADYSNYRIVAWRKNATSGELVAGGNDQGDREDQLNEPRNVIIDHRNDFLIISDRSNQRVVGWPRVNGINGKIIISNIECHGLAMDYYGYLYVANAEKSEVRRWKIGEKNGTLVADGNGTLVAGGNGKGKNRNQLNQPRYIFVDEERSVYVSDNYNHRIVKWLKGAKEGIIVAGGKGLGKDKNQLHAPEGFVVDQVDTIYVADSQNDRVIRWMKEASEGEPIVGGDERGQSTDELNSPRDIFFDREGNLYVVEHDNHRVQKFSINQLK